VGSVDDKCNVNVRGRLKEGKMSLARRKKTNEEILNKNTKNKVTIYLKHTQDQLNKNVSFTLKQVYLSTTSSNPPTKSPST